MTIHHAAQHGYEKESAAYQRGRPDYPDALMDWLRQDLGLRPGTHALDLGAGTGKFTRLLTRTGASLTAVEPVAEMREQIGRHAEGVLALAGTAEAIPLPDALPATHASPASPTSSGAGATPETGLDVVVCAQAFHWFANAQALREIHRVLRPGGRLGLVWNVRDESVDWVAATTAIITPYEGDAPRYYKGDWRQPFEAQPLFSPLVRASFPHQHVGSFEQVVIDRFMSVSFIASLPEAEKQSVATRLWALRDRFPALQAETVAYPYLTEAWRTERLTP
ncbi:Methyltransferase domain-containing protein [Roseateles sp. YR242]|uniref:class I SAM-dependent methyltransferase n=1 Tax=Roseateles sp. YR242 TaxID=1855305 RepID=UPI0008D77D9E|nr:class I SAM-dependent methyltransferase [Roseateles sp. YR242]SEK40594.1 Methyltransferase domain-containing protein [Roseateles sp. YR242]